MHNIIPFPKEPARLGLTISQAANAQAEAFYFKLRDKVEFLSDGQQGYVTDGRPRFGRAGIWCYTVLITDGRDAGTLRVTLASAITLVEAAGE